MAKGYNNKKDKKLSKDNHDTLDSFIDKDEEPAMPSTTIALEPAADKEQISPNRRYIYKDGTSTTVVYDGKNPNYVEVKYSKA
jgi:hypothetical protein